MSEITNDATLAGETASEASAARERDRARLRRIASIHLVMVMGALTLWGAADSWAVTSGWGLAWAAAILNALIAAYVISATLHEWGHFAGARLSGSVAPVLKEPVRYFFMFDFKFEHNDSRQFLWMSLGGILTPWLLVVATPLLVPIDNASRVMLLAVFLAQAVSVSVFEAPVALRAWNGGEPRAELERQLRAGVLKKSRYYGVAAGVLLWLAV